MNDETTYTPYAITINIPNVNCERCSLHLSNPMTDKIGSDGSPTGIGCSDPGTCSSVYHSCTRPFRIIGDVDDGAVERSEYVCPSLQSSNPDWPTIWEGDNGEDVDASVPGVYRRESSAWSTEDFTLTTVPVQYTENAGALCGDGVAIVDGKDPTSSPTMMTAKIHDVPSLTTNSPSAATAVEVVAEPSLSDGQTDNVLTSETTPSPSDLNALDELQQFQSPSSEAHAGLKSFYGNYLLMICTVGYVVV